MTGAAMFGKWLVGLLGGIRATSWFVALLLALALGHYWKGRALGAEAKAKALVAEAVLADAKLKAAQASVTVQTVTKYVDRVQVVQGRTRTIVKEVPIYVPADSADLPPGFRVLHDAAALGELPDPARVADAAPVPAQDAAASVASNYGQCHETEAQLAALQDWIRAQQALK